MRVRLLATLVMLLASPPSASAEAGHAYPRPPWEPVFDAEHPERGIVALKRREDPEASGDNAAIVAEVPLSSGRSLAVVLFGELTTPAMAVIDPGTTSQRRVRCLVQPPATGQEGLYPSWSSDQTLLPDGKVLVVLSGQGGDGGEGWSSVTAGTVSDRCEWTFILKRYAEWTCVNDRGDFGPCHGQVVQGKSKTKDQIVIQATTINADGSRGAKPSSESLEVSSLIRAAAASRSAALAGGWKEPGLCQVIGTVGGRLSLPMNQGSSSGPGVATLNYRQVAKFEGGVPSVMRVAPSDLDARIALLKLEPPEPAKADCFAVMEIFADGRVTLSSPFGSCGDVDGVERADAGWSIRIRPEKAKVMEIWQYEAGSAKRTAGQGP